MVAKGSLTLNNISISLLNNKMISKNYIYAVVDASDSEEKYGFKVFRDLLESGYKVLPVNINEKVILGVRSYKTLSDIKEKIDVAIMVVKPEVTKEIVKEALRNGIKNIWMQPGSEEVSAIQFCHENGISCISNACIMVQRNQMDNKIN